MRLPWRPPGGDAAGEPANAVHTPGDVTGVVPTRTMLALWPPGAFPAGALEAAVAVGRAVPLDVGSGGEFAVLLRVGSVTEPAELTERELRYLLLASEPYLFVSEGRAVVSGLDDPADGALDVGLPPGRWGVTAHVLDWELEPDAVGPDGVPAADALPDFVVLLNPERGDAARYRTAVATFDPPAAPA